MHVDKVYFDIVYFDIVYINNVFVDKDRQLDNQRGRQSDSRRCSRKGRGSQTCSFRSPTRQPTRQPTSTFIEDETTQNLFEFRETKKHFMVFPKHTVFIFLYYDC